MDLLSNILKKKAYGAYKLGHFRFCNNNIHLLDKIMFDVYVGITSMTTGILVTTINIQDQQHTCIKLFTSSRKDSYVCECFGVLISAAA